MGVGFSKWPLFVLTFVASLGGMSVTGCDRLGAGSSDTIRIQLGSEPASLDPSLAEDGASLRVLFNTMDGLVGYDGAGKLQNQLAESYGVSADGTRYEFTLRGGAKWSDGQPVQASDFVTALRRALAPGSTSRLAGMLYPIRGARRLAAGKARPEDLGVRSEGEAPGRLVIELERKTPYFIQVLSLPVALPSRQDVLDAHSGRWPEIAPVTGPYRITRHESDQRIVFEANENYWDKQRPRPAVEMLVIADESTGVNLFQQGKLDVLTKVPSSDLARLKERGVIHSDPFLAVYYLSFNLKRSPFNDRALRRAVSAAIRREELVQALDSGDTPANSWLPPGLEGHVPFDLSKTTLRKKPSGLDVPAQPVAAAFDTGQRNSTAMEKVQQDLRAALGLKLALSNLDWKAYLKSLQSDAPPIFRMGMLSPVLDPIQILVSFTTGDPNNYIHWSNASYDQLVNQIAGLAPGAERAAKIRQAQALLVDDEAAVVPLFHYVQNTAVAPRIQGLRANPFGVILFSDLGIRKP
jgi:oligopeptide transport system substrate-binding protein